jgi:hypothetical protein
MNNVDVKEKLAAARASKDAREKMKAEETASRELEVLELEERFEKELGPRGSFFEVVETVDGPIVLKLGEAVLHTRFAESKVTPNDIHDYVFPCVAYPTKEKFLEIVGRRPGLALRCANALATLYGAKANAEAGKF